MRKLRRKTPTERHCIKPVKQKLTVGLLVQVASIHVHLENIIGCGRPYEIQTPNIIIYFLSSYDSTVRVSVNA